MKNYNQIRATLAITKASLQGMLKSPSAVIFSLAFPIIFILVFGFIGGGNGVSKVDIVFGPNCDTTNQLYHLLVTSAFITTKDIMPDRQLTELNKGNIDGIINIAAKTDSLQPYYIDLLLSKATPQKAAMLKTIINQINYNATLSKWANLKPYSQINEQWVESRPYKTIDFILPGQLGFSMLSAGVFGAAFVFFNLRQSLVIKRFFATPIRRTNIVLGEALSRLIFQSVAASIIILLGRFFFGFTLLYGFFTFIQMLFLCVMGLSVFMGFGFIVSSLAKNETSIPPFANLITLPQFLLAGTFFSVDVFPKWLQPISKALPLTYLNDALRKVAFEGQNLWQVKMQIAVLLVWGIIAYAIAIKTFRWE
jgi:ABC-2 type transport system permease protein